MNECEGERKRAVVFFMIFLQRRALAWVELECDIRFLSGGKPRKEVPMFFRVSLHILGLFRSHFLCP